MLIVPVLLSPFCIKVNVLLKVIFVTCPIVHVFRHDTMVLHVLLLSIVQCIKQTAIVLLEQFFFLSAHKDSSPE